ncbi:hypothetical protein SLS62_010532 [Diatrype stigma]|uniref:Copper acquisition factor BIM1-like domain-containing protein n=1 Tax=Diatrype stigma TaxID=117547 RepID=A0AAN9UHS6_9PEZI
MARLISLLAVAITLTCGVVRGHFSLTYPSPVGELNEDDEGTGPCGGYTPDLQTVNTTDFHVGGDSIVVSTSHPQSHWLYRITTGSAAAATENWTQVYPIVLQSGINSYCQPAITIPEELIGQKAILSIVGTATDGLLYQCAAVKFVSGTGSKVDACTNSTGVTASFENDSELAGLVGQGNPTDDESASNGSVTASSIPSDTPGAAAATYGLVQGFGPLIIVGFMMVLGTGLMV